MDETRQAADQAPLVTRDDSAGRYVISVGGAVAGSAWFSRDGEVLTFTHTEVDPAFNGQGLGSLLVAGALADVRASGLRAVPRCAFVARYVSRHPEVADLVEG